MAAMAPLEVQMGDVNAQNLGQLRTLNEHTFPVSSPTSFMTRSRRCPRASRFAYCGGFAVGNCCARLEAFRNTEEKRKKLYIMTIGVLHAYRRRGIGRKLLTQLLESAAARKDVKVIYLHVQTGNDTARDFYAQFGFREIGVIRGYRHPAGLVRVLTSALSDGDDPAVLSPGVPGSRVTAGVLVAVGGAARPTYRITAATWAVQLTQMRRDGEVPHNVGRHPDTIKLHMDVPPDGLRPPRARRAAGSLPSHAAPAAARWKIEALVVLPSRSAAVAFSTPHNHLYANATWRHNTTAINMLSATTWPFRERDDRCQRALPADRAGARGGGLYTGGSGEEPVALVRSSKREARRVLPFVTAASSAA